MFRKSMAAALVVAIYPAQPALGGFIIFNDRESFTLFNFLEGKVLKVPEDFEEGFIPAGFIVHLTDPLVHGVPNIDPDTGFGFDNGLISENLIVQSNAMGLHAASAAPGGGLAMVGPDALALGVPNSIVVGADAFSDSTDLIFLEPNHTGVGFDVIDPISAANGGIVHISVYDKADMLIVHDHVPAALNKVFWGIWSDETIGRINIGTEDANFLAGGELIDNIDMWVPAPGALAVLALGGLALGRRRRVDDP